MFLKMFKNENEVNIIQIVKRARKFENVEF